MQAQGDYRIFVGAFPSGELGERIQALRLRYDAKTAHITNAHVTLAGTYWRSGLPTPENEAQTIERLKAVQALIPPFNLMLGGVETFLPDTPVIYLRVEPTSSLLTARRVLLEALGPDKHSQFTPHVTLTMRLPRPETEVLLAQLRESKWHTGRWTMYLEDLWLMQRGVNDRSWRPIQRIRLLGQ